MLWAIDIGMDRREKNTTHDLTRRQFTALAAGGMVSLLPGCSGQRGVAVAASEGAALAHNGDPAATVILAAVSRGAGPVATEAAVRAAAQAVDDLAWLGRGDTVLIKPVCNSGNAYPATTDPLALRAMIGLLRERGAGRVLVADMSGVQSVRFSKDELRGSTRALMQSNGMLRAVEDAGGEIYAFEEHGWDSFFDDYPTAVGSWSGPILMPNVLREVDHVVLMPRCARHLLAGSTLGMKAAVGWWRHDARREYHHDAATLHEKTADANTVPSLTSRLRLVLSSATQVLTTFGPDNGEVVTPSSGLVMASSSLVAHDMASLAWLLENRRTMPAAARDGMFDDPNTSSLYVNFANRIVTHWLGGSAFTTEWLTRYDMQAIWDDRVLRRAFTLSRGVPRVNLADAGNAVPSELQQRLISALALPA